METLSYNFTMYGHVAIRVCPSLWSLIRKLRGRHFVFGGLWANPPRHACLKRNTHPCFDMFWWCVYLLHWSYLSQSQWADTGRSCFCEAWKAWAGLVGKWTWNMVLPEVYHKWFPVSNIPLAWFRVCVKHCKALLNQSKPCFFFSYAEGGWDE